MEQDQLEAIIDKYLKGKTNPEEEKILEGVFQNRLKADFMTKDFSEERKAQIKKELRQRLQSKTQPKLPLENRQVWMVIGKIAASLLLIAGLTYLFTRLPSVEKTDEIQYLSKTTQAGQKSKLELSDGTIVYLNASSKLTYPVTFTSTREVSLQGEAYFEVAENPDKPFIVRSGGINTRVLGTRFNVKHYQAEASVTVSEGKVLVETRKQGEVVTLTSNQQVNFLPRDSTLQVAQVDAESLIAWTRGRLVINNQSLAVVEPLLERWYGVEIQLQDESLSGCLFTTDMQQEPLEVLLKDLQLTLNIQYRITGDTVYLSGDGCN